MSKKTKIIIIVSCIVAEIGLLTGAYAIGRNTRYKNKTDIGGEVINNINGAKTDVTGANGNVDSAISFLDPAISANLLNIKTLEYLKKNNEKKSVVIEKLVDSFKRTEEALGNFEKTYKGSNEDYAWALAVKESEELEQLLKDYKEIIDSYDANQGEMK